MLRNIGMLAVLESKLPVLELQFKKSWRDPVIWLTQELPFFINYFGVQGSTKPSFFSNFVFTRRSIAVLCSTTLVTWVYLLLFMKESAKSLACLDSLSMQATKSRVLTDLFMKLGVINLSFISS